MVERWVVVPDAEGSSPFIHPLYCLLLWRHKQENQDMRTAKQIFEGTIASLLRDPRGQDVLKKINTTYCFKISGEGGGTYTVGLKPGGEVLEGEHENDCIATADIETANKLFDKPGSALLSVMTGKLKFTSMSMATKLKALGDIKV